MTTVTTKTMPDAFWPCPAVLWEREALGVPTLSALCSLNSSDSCYALPLLSESPPTLDQHACLCTNHESRTFCREKEPVASPGI